MTDPKPVGRPMLKPKQWERRAPGKTRPDPVLQAADLARALGCGQNADPAAALQRIGTR
jgi:hypothetical protein